MRNEKRLLDSFMPLHEKEWEARLLIDEAIKNKVEYNLETLARALSGNNNIKFAYADKEALFISNESLKSNKGDWFERTEKFKIEARMREFIFYGNTKTQIWLKIIDFWAGKETAKTCGGASFPNHTITCVSEDDLRKEQNETEN